MAEELLKGRSSVAVSTPDLDPLVHGSYNSFWAYVHDLIHTFFRIEIGQWEIELIGLAFAIDKNVERVNYDHKTTYDYGMLNPEFKQVPTIEETVAYGIDRICSEVVDGFWTPEAHMTIRDFLMKVVLDAELTKIIDTLNRKFSISLSKSEIKEKIIEKIAAVIK